MIIWRHAAPVRLATNVPTELLNDSAAEPPSRAPQRKEAAGAPKAASSSRHEIRQQYGAWYLPVEQWSSRTATGSPPKEGEEARAKKQGRAEEARREASAEDEGWSEAEEKLNGEHAELIPQLYSSKLYKEYLREKRIHRIPHYLSRVEEPKSQMGSPSSPPRAPASPSPAVGGQTLLERARDGTAPL